MRKLHNKIASAFVLCLGLLLGVATPVFADSLYTNPETGYEVVIEDDASLLSDDELAELESYMEPITAYGNAVFKSVSENSSSTRSYADRYYESQFGSESGTLLLIDMDNRYIYIHNTGAISYTITSSQSDIITDNIYRYASDGDYLGCASLAYEQLFQLLEGGRIAQPMKYICNILLSVILALLINYALVRFFTASKKPSTNQLLAGAYTKCELHNAHADFTHQTKTYSPRSSSGSGSHGGGGGHSGGGGSHHSGGGHRF